MPYCAQLCTAPVIGIVGGAVLLTKYIDNKSVVYVRRFAQ